MRLAAPLGAVLWLGLATAASAAPEPASAIDRLFAQFSAQTPGCVVGVDQVGQSPWVRGYGAADLEHGSPNQADTPLEAGSVSKQFTAAAVLLLAQRGRLGLQDDVRKYIPELPDYGRPITIEHLLTHTSGLRDWGSIEQLAGWPRGDRVYSLRDVLAVTRRQAALNAPPGAAWSYTNTGFNLLAIIVERVSGQSLADFSRIEMFQPLGMANTQWRDDFRRIVPGRAVAYQRDAGAYRQDMPFENAYGNGGLITTVPDLLVWNRALSAGRLGAGIADQLQVPAKLKDGRALGYARGLFVARYRATLELAHSGSTAGYRAWLGRYPEKGLSIALLCNAAEADTAALAHAVADLYLPPDTGPSRSPDLHPAPARLAGWYANDRDGAPLHLLDGGGRLQTGAGEPVSQAADGALRIGHRVMTVGPGDRLEAPNQGDPIVFTRRPAFTPSGAGLAAVAGRYRNDEIDATYRVDFNAGVLTLTNEGRPDAAFAMRPAYADAFTYPDGVARLIRGAGGRIVGFRLSNERVWNLPFKRQPAARRRWAQDPARNRAAR